MKGAYKYRKKYPLVCYSGDMGDLISLKNGFLEVGGYDDQNPLSEDVINKLKKKYEGKYNRVFWGYTLFRGNPSLSCSDEYILDSMCHVYFEIIEDGKPNLYTIIYYKGEYYLTFLDMYLQDGMSNKLLNSDFVIVEVEDGTIGMCLVEEGHIEKFKNVKKFERCFFMDIIDKLGDLGKFIKRVVEDF